MILHAKSTSSRLRFSLLAAACFVSCIACTPVGPATSPQRSRGDAGERDGAVADASPPEGPSDDRDASMVMTGDTGCDTGGALRCANDPRGRERCESGRWIEAEPCSEDEVCAVSKAKAAECVPLVDVCRGNSGAIVCDGEGTMFRCNDNGAVESRERCTSPRHCQVGLAARSCAKCLPGQFRCNGNTLEACGEAGSKYEKAETCEAGTCDAQAGLCRGTKCAEERAICIGDVLKVCARGAKEFTELAQCGPNLCNAGAARCDVCVPGTRSCEGDYAVTCSADGSTRERTDCAEKSEHCVGAGQCVGCTRDADCGASGPCERAYCDVPRGMCTKQPRPQGYSCPKGTCSGDGQCVECTADQHCGANANCVSNACACKPGYVKNPDGKGCNFDDCAKPDDNHCAAGVSGNTCSNTIDGYDCKCGSGWKLGKDQCFQGGASADVRTVKNGASWNVFPDFGIACENAFDTNTPCTTGQLTWLNLCGLPDTKPNDCSALAANSSDSLLATKVKRVMHSGALQDFGEPNGQGDERVLLPAVDDVIAVQTLTALYLMRITAIDGGSMTYEWAAVWRDACWRPGGLTCTAACGCPGGN